MGSVKNVVVSGSGTTSTTLSKNLATFTLPSAGSWLVNVSCALTTGAADVTISISNATDSFQSNAATSVLLGRYSNFSYPLTVFASTPMYLVGGATGVVSTISPIWVFIARIG